MRCNASASNSYAAGSGELAAPRRQSLLRSCLATRSFPRRLPATCSAAARLQTLLAIMDHLRDARVSEGRVRRGIRGLRRRCVIVTNPLHPNRAFRMAERFRNGGAGAMQHFQGVIFRVGPVGGLDLATVASAFGR